MFNIINNAIFNNKYTQKRFKNSILIYFLNLLRYKLFQAFILMLSLVIIIYLWIYYPIQQGHQGDFILMLSNRKSIGYWDGYGVGYGPIFAIYDLAFRGVSDQIVMNIMFVLNLFILLIIFLILLHRFLPKPRSIEETLAAIFLWVSFYPTFQTLRQNNIEITEFLFLALMLEALRLRRDVLAGIWLGIASATKILPLILVFYFLWRRRFKLAIISIFTTVFLFCIVVMFKGESVGIAFTKLWSYSVQPFPYQFQGNQSISGLFSRAFSQYDLSNRLTIEIPVILNIEAAKTATIIISTIIFLIVSITIFRRTRIFPLPVTDIRIESVEIAIVLTGMLILLPHNHTHYFILIAWIYLAFIREWPRPESTKGRCVVFLTSISFLLLGLLTIWRLFDPFLVLIGPVTGIDLARLASFPLFGAISGLIALLIIHGNLISSNEDGFNE